MPDNPSSATEDRVVSIRRGKHLGSRPAQANTPSVGDLSKFEQDAEPDDYRHRMIANVLAFVFVALLVIAGLWLATTLATMRKNQDCVLSGKRGCSPVEAPASGR